MPPQEQAELWMQLRDRMKTNWSELTYAEKKACECCSYCGSQLIKCMRMHKALQLINFETHGLSLTLIIMTDQSFRA